MRNSLVLIILVLLFGLLQSSFFFDVLKINDVKPDIALILVVFVAFKEGSTKGQFVGFGTGMLQHFFSTALFGIYAFMYTVVGFVMGFMKQKVDSNSFLSAMLLVFGATLVKGLALGFLALFFGEASLEFGEYVKKALLLELIYNSVLAGPVFWLLSRFAAPAL